MYGFGDGAPPGFRAAGVKIAVRVTPGSARARAGGWSGDTGALVGAVPERAADGRAANALAARLDGLRG